MVSKHSVSDLIDIALHKRKEEIEKKYGGDISKNSFIHVEGITPPGLEGSGKKKPKKSGKYDLLHERIEPFEFEFMKSKSKKGGMLLIDDLKPAVGGAKPKSKSKSKKHGDGGKALEQFVKQVKKVQEMYGLTYREAQMKVKEMNNK